MAVCSQSHAKACSPSSTSSLIQQNLLDALLSRQIPVLAAFFDSHRAELSQLLTHSFDGSLVRDAAAHGWLPLSLVSRDSRLQSADKIAILRLLLSHGAPIDQQDESGSTALHYALATGDLEAALFLLEIGKANPLLLMKDDENMQRSAVAYLLQQDRVDVVQQLLKQRRIEWDSIIECHERDGASKTLVEVMHEHQNHQVQQVDKLTQRLKQAKSRMLTAEALLVNARAQGADFCVREQVQRTREEACLRRLTKCQEVEEQARGRLEEAERYLLVIRKLSEIKPSETVRTSSLDVTEPISPLPTATIMDDTSNTTTEKLSCQEKISESASYVRSNPTTQIRITPEKAGISEVQESAESRCSSTHFDSSDVNLSATESSRKRARSPSALSLASSDHLHRSDCGKDVRRRISPFDLCSDYLRDLNRERFPEFMQTLLIAVRECTLNECFTILDRLCQSAQSICNLAHNINDIPACKDAVRVILDRAMSACPPLLPTRVAELHRHVRVLAVASCVDRSILMLHPLFRQSLSSTQPLESRAAFRDATAQPMTSMDESSTRMSVRYNSSSELSEVSTVRTFVKMEIWRMSLTQLASWMDDPLINLTAAEVRYVIYSLAVRGNRPMNGPAFQLLLVRAMNILVDTVTQVPVNIPINALHSGVQLMRQNLDVKPIPTLFPWEICFLRTIEVRPLASSTLTPDRFLSACLSRGHDISGLLWSMRHFAEAGILPRGVFASMPVSAMLQILTEHCEHPRFLSASLCAIGGLVCVYPEHIRFQISLSELSQKFASCVDAWDATGISNTFWGIVRCAEVGGTDATTSSSSVETLAISMIDRLCEISRTCCLLHLADICWSLARLSELGLLKPSPNCMTRVRHLFHVFLSLRPEPRESRSLSRVLWGVARLSYSSTATAVDFAAILSGQQVFGLLRRICGDQPDVQTISNSLWAIGTFLDMHLVSIPEQSLSDSTVLVKLLEALVAQTPTAQAVHNSLWALGHFVRFRALSTSGDFCANHLPLDQLFSVIDAHHTTLELPGITSVIWATGEMLHRRFLREDTVIRYGMMLMSMMDRLPQLNSDARALSVALWTLARFPTQVIQQNSKRVVSLFVFFVQLYGAHDDVRDAFDIAEQLRSIARLSERVDTASKDELTTQIPFEVLVQHVLECTFRPMAVSIVIWSIGKLVQTGVLTRDTFRTLPVQGLLKYFTDQAALAVLGGVGTTRVLWTLAQWADAGLCRGYAGLVLDDALWVDLPLNIIRAIDSKEDMDWIDRANILWAFGKLCKNRICSATDIADCTDRLISQFPQDVDHMDLASQTMSLCGVSQINLLLSSPIPTRECTSPAVITDAATAQSNNRIRFCSQLLSQIAQSHELNDEAFSLSMGSVARLASTAAVKADPANLVALSNCVATILGRLSTRSVKPLAIAGILVALKVLRTQNFTLPKNLGSCTVVPLVLQLVAHSPDVRNASAVSNSLDALRHLHTLESFSRDDVAQIPLESLVASLIRTSPSASEIADSVFATGILVSAAHNISSLMSSFALLIERIVLLWKHSRNGFTQRGGQEAARVLHGSIAVLDRYQRTINSNSNKSLLNRVTAQLVDVCRFLSFKKSAVESDILAVEAICKLLCMDEVKLDLYKCTLRCVLRRVTRFGLSHEQYKRLRSAVRRLPDSDFSTEMQDCVTHAEQSYQESARKHKSASISSRQVEVGLNHDQASAVRKSDSIATNPPQIVPIPESAGVLQQVCNGARDTILGLHSVANHRTHVHKQDDLHYNISDEAQRAKLQRDCQIHYQLGRKAIPDFLIAPVAVVPGAALGVYAKYPLSYQNHKATASRNLLGKYVGERITDACPSDSAYVFEIGGGSALIDAKRIRDWTAFVNHSETPNLQVREVAGNIYFELARNIPSGHQLFIDYGDHYFEWLGFSPCYLHPTDNWRPLIERILQQRTSYLADAIIISKSEAINLRLSIRHLSGASVLADNILLLASPTVKFLLDLELGSDAPIPCDLIAPEEVDLLCYTLEVNAGTKQLQCCNETSHQQHLTALMVACHRRNWAAIRQLISNGADVNRRTLQSGDSPLFYLLRGSAMIVDRVQLREAIQALLDHDAFVHLCNAEGHSLVHYCLQQDDVTSLIQLLHAPQAKKYHARILSHIMEVEGHEDFETCLQRGALHLLEPLLRFAGKQWLLDAFDGLAFLHQAIHTLPQDVARNALEMIFLNLKALRVSASDRARIQQMFSSSPQAINKLIQPA